MEPQIPLTDYLAFNAHDNARMLVEKYGLPKVVPGDFKDLRRKLAYVAKTYGDEAFIDFARIHPDRKFIEETAPHMKHSNFAEELESQACGCSHFGGEMNSMNCSGCSSHANGEGGCKCGCGGKCGGNKNRGKNGRSSFNGDDDNTVVVHNQPSTVAVVSLTLGITIGLVLLIQATN